MRPRRGPRSAPKSPPRRPRRPGRAARTPRPPRSPPLRGPNRRPPARPRDRPKSIRIERLWLDRRPISLALKITRTSGGQRGCAVLPVSRPLPQQLSDDHEGLVPHRHRRPLLAQPLRPPPVGRAEDRPPGLHRRPRHRHQDRARPHAPLGRPAAPPRRRRSDRRPGTSPPNSPAAPPSRTGSCPARSPPRSPRPPWRRGPRSSAAAPPPRRTGPSPRRSGPPAARPGPRCARSGPAAAAAGSGGARRRGRPAPASAGGPCPAAAPAPARPAHGASRPAISARIMARPETPSPSLAAPAGLMSASSGTSGTRSTTATRSWTGSVRCRVRARRARTSGGGTKPGASRPCASSRAIHAAPLTSVLPPGTCLMGRALTSSGAKRSPSRCRSAPSKRRSIPSRHGGPPRPRANRPEPAARRSWCRRCGPGSAPGHRGRRGGCRRRRSPCGRPVRHRSGGSGPSGWLRGDIGSAMVSAPGRPRRIEPFALRAPRVVRGRRGRVRRGVGRGRGPVRLRAEAPKRRRPCPGPSPSGIDPMRSIFMGSGA